MRSKMNIRLLVEKSEASNGVTSYISKIFRTPKIPKFECALSAEQNLKEAAKLGSGPIALFAALTAEEEAATFLYHVFMHRGYNLPDLKRLHAHQDKVRVTLWAKALIEHFTAIADAIDPEGVFKIEYRGDRPIIVYRFSIPGPYGFSTNILEAIMRQEGDAEHPAYQAVDAALESAISDWGSIEKAVASIAKQRNLCLYGDPLKKPCLSESRGWEVSDLNCAALIMLGIMIHQSESRLEPVQLVSGLAAERVGLHRKAKPYTRPK